MNKNILIVGVGGQGTLLASKIMGNAANLLGLDVKISEVHGMAQRGGSVVTHVKMGERVFAPVVAKGGADYILAFEKLEAARYTEFLKEGGTIIANKKEIYPMPVIIGAAEYPKDIIEKLKESFKVVEIDAESVALELKNPRCANVVMVGALLKRMGVSLDIALSALKESVKPEFFAVNAEAMKRGYGIG
ncbi:MAG TPA: indolepyruvate oxidoreductase subunit beta [Eubacteriales bacterium]|jgi:indolepyruvate ferredoxin oxidoreductase beta subunit|nr:indolepyruvate oxidoreductase subunit beta [Clostridia bacterium]HRR90244.1 indolepyruvate oxidoreductase subunit beta [Eubacteriales bacterium]HRU84404.1 indolepyruvate oxidoreductase subunit beta [Eubacteriales bacterium]